MQTTKPTTTTKQSQVTATLVNVNLENTPGELGRCARALADANINIEGFNCGEQGTRFLVNDPARAVDVLANADFDVDTVDCFAVNLPNTPGSLARLGEELAKAEINIETCFGVGGTQTNARIFVEVDDPTKARPILERLATGPTSTPRSGR